MGKGQINIHYRQQMSFSPALVPPDTFLQLSSFHFATAELTYLCFWPKHTENTLKPYSNKLCMLVKVEFVRIIWFGGIPLTSACKHTNTWTQRQITNGPPGGRCGVFHGSEPSQPPVSLWSALDGHTLCSGPPSWLSAHPSPGAVSLNPFLFGATGNAVKSVLEFKHTLKQPL